MLGATCEIPWPPFYEAMLNTMAAINIDVSMIREPLNAMMKALGEQVGQASCNFNDMSAEDMCVGLFCHHTHIGAGRSLA